MGKGTMGYIDQIKKKNLTFGVSGIAAMFAIFITGIMVTGSNASFATLLAVLIALPAAQMLARYFSLAKYKSVDGDLVDQLDSLDGVTCLYELVVVQGKLNYYLEAAVISDHSLCILDTSNGVDGKALQRMLGHKGIMIDVLVYDRLEALIEGSAGISEMTLASHDLIRKKLLENSL